MTPVRQGLARLEWRVRCIATRRVGWAHGTRRGDGQPCVLRARDTNNVMLCYVMSTRRGVCDCASVLIGGLAVFLLVAVSPLSARLLCGGGCALSWAVLAVLVVLKEPARHPGEISRG